jgi:hypothetical protein
MTGIYNYPEKSGNIDIYPQIIDANQVAVTIMGDKEGLRYLASLLNWMADFDQESNADPDGTREHIHLHRETQLGCFSCEVSLCRADAKGTGELPDFMK